MFRLLLGGLEGLEALDELPPERLERRVPVEAREAAHLEDGVAEVPEHGHGQQDRRPEGRALRLFDGLNLAHRFLCIVSLPPPTP